MRTTTDEATVGAMLDLTTVADSITRTTLDARHGLPREANGRHTAPSNPRAAQIMKEMAAGRSHEIARLMTVLYTNLEDGVSYQIATAGIRRMLTFLQLHANAMRRHEARPIASAFHSETKAQHRGDLSAHRVIQSSCTTQDLTDAIAATHSHIAALEEFARSCEAELAERQTRRTYTIQRLSARV